MIIANIHVTAIATLTLNSLHILRTFMGCLIAKYRSVPIQTMVITLPSIDTPERDEKNIDLF